MTSPNNMTNFIVRLRGLPWSTTQNEVQYFLYGCKIRRIQFLLNEQGRSTGECFVVLESKKDVDLAKSCDKKMIGTRYIEVFESSPEAMSDMIRNYRLSNDPSKSQNNLSSDDSWTEPVLRLRGLPYSATKSDIMQFFNGLAIAQNGIHISSSKPAGEAFVAFTNMDNALRALEFNRMNMGHRYIEVFKSTYAEARASIITDTRQMIREKASGSVPPSATTSNIPLSAHKNQNYGIEKDSYGISSSMVNYSYSYDNNDDVYADGNYETATLKRPMIPSFMIKLRGVPYEAREKDIFDFFNPVTPIRVEREESTRSRPSMWYAEFGSREEANEAMTYHKKHMGTRYVELFPLYDNDKSKMIRTST